MGSVLRGAGWMAGAQIARLLAQATTFVIIARVLGANGLGQFAAALAVVYMLFPFAGLGTGNVLVRDTARAPHTFAAKFGTALATTAATAFALVPTAIGAGVWIVGLPGSVVALLALSELVFAKLTDVASQAFQAQERARECAAITMLVSCSRACVAALYATLAADPSVVGWSVCYLGCTAVCTLCGLAAAAASLGRPVRPPRPSLRVLRSGALFSLSLSGSMISADIDKVMLARLDTLAAVGVYTAAYRATSFALAPITSFFWAAYARFFRHGQTGIVGTVDFARRISPGPVGFGIAAGLALFAAAPLLSHVLGGGFEPSTSALRWLAPLPAISALGYLAADTLTGADRQGVCTSLQLAAAGLNVVLNALLIPAHSWRGAACATLVSYGSLAVGLWLAVAALARRGLQATPAAEPRGLS